YDRNNFIKNDIVSDYINLIGLSEQVANSSDLKVQSNNPSLPDSMVDMKRIYNAVERLANNSTRRNIGRKMAAMPTMAFGTRPANGGDSIRRALEHEHQKLADRYGLDLGEVSDPFAGAPEGPIKGQAEMVIQAMTWNDLQ